MKKWGVLMQPVRFQILDLDGKPLFEKPLTSRDVADLMKDLGDGTGEVVTVLDELPIVDNSEEQDNKKGQV